MLHLLRNLGNGCISLVINTSKKMSKLACYGNIFLSLTPCFFNYHLQGSSTLC
uniref:Uncharacterized protein n=1 Tax=Rhizophora mucronata TaxID=61149 RepID=A0A2P2QT33_RHIMU